ncbi:MAG: O-antigen translocase [Muribaculaceae bacterium]|nr:O-antigen translocase [Muribaculaceae bacterium]
MSHPVEIETEQIGNREKKDLNSYRNIIKSSSFFGGVQIFNIIITLIRGKFVAIILGPDGMGISALFNSASNTIQRFSSLGLNQSIIRQVAEESADRSKLERTVRTSLGFSNLTALLGFIICAALCIPLSRITFGVTDYWWQFIILGVGVAFAIAGTSKLSILQGLHEVKRISRSSIVGGLTGLCVGIPLYYLFGTKGIVPAIVAVFLALYIFYSISLKRSFSFQNPPESWKEQWPVAKILLGFGIVLMAGDLITTLVTYLINLFVRNFGDVDEVGLYQAAHSVTYQFSGMIFAALSMEYFPRLSEAATDNAKMNKVVNRQSEIVAWLMTPAMSLLIISTPILIRILLSQEFHSIIPLMRWMGLGMLLRAFSFPMAYITFAKGNKRVFFLLEGIFANLLTLILSCGFFHWYGLIGLGYAIVVDNALCFLLYYLVNNRLYGYKFSGRAYLNFAVGAILTGGCFIFSILESPALAYSLMGVATAIALIWGFFSIKNHLNQ